MNLGDGLLFELENGKPKLILLSHGVERNPEKLSCRPRVASILSSRQPTSVEDVLGEGERPARLQARRHKTGGAAASFASNSATTGGRSASRTSSKTHEHHKGGSVKVLAKVKSDRHKQTTAVATLRANGKTGRSQKSGTRVGGKDSLASGDSGLKDSMACLASEQLQQILNTVETTSNGRDPPEDHKPQGNQTDSKSGSSTNSGEGGGKRKEEDRGGGKDINKGGGEGGADVTVSSQKKDNRLSAGMFSWLDEQQSESRAAVDAKKAQWRRELDEQLVLKQQRSAPGRLQAEEDTVSLLSVQSSFSHREQPAAIRSSLKIGEVTPMEEVLSIKRKEEQKRRWLEELDKQREETTERRRREKLLQSQTEDHELSVTHFDSLQRRPPVQTAPPPPPPPPGPSNGSERGDWEPSSSLSLVWEAMSSCGAESVGGTSVDTTSGYPTRTSYLRTMTALLDPAQIEERERRRLKQLEQQRVIEAQVEERRRQREREEARRKEEEEEEERRLALEREMLERRHELDALKEMQKEQASHQAEEPNKDHGDKTHQEAPEPRGARQDECLEEPSRSTHKDTAVQTEAAPSLLPTAEGVQTPHTSAQHQPPPPNRRNRAVRTGKENICRHEGGGGGGDGDPYEAFARTERSRRDKRRPEWNTQRPSRQFVPASERYPASLQRNRQESRMKRQAELLALQERACISRTNPPPPPPPQHQEPRLCPSLPQTRTSPTKKVESVSRGHSSSERGRSPPVPAVRCRVQNQQAPPSSSSPPPAPPPVLEFIPYVRTDEVFNLDPLEPAETPPPHTHTEAPARSSAAPPAPSHPDHLLYPELLPNAHTRRQKEILKGLAQLRQGLLQKQRELETDLNPLLRRHDNERR